MRGSSAQAGRTTEAAGSDDSVAVIVTTYNDADFLQEAISSVIAQQRTADEIIIVDDGSDESPESLLADFPQLVFIRKSNGGLSSARNAGLYRASSRNITFLDADDRYEPNAIASGLACFARKPEAAMVYGGYRRIRADGKPIDSGHFQAVDGDAYADLLTTNIIGMHAAVLYRRDVLLELGGFDEKLRMCEDYDLYLRLARSYPIASYPEIVAEYRCHGRNISTNTSEMRRAVLAVHERHRDQMHKFRQAWHAGQRNWKASYNAEKQLHQEGTVAQMIRRLKRSVVRRTKNQLRGSRLHRLVSRFRHSWPPPFGAIRFGDLGSTRPISLDFGYDRGTPVDRYYIENFLTDRAADVRGRVLEVAEDTYSQRFGGARVTQQDVLHLYAEDPKVTIAGDLTQPGVLPNDAFDCIILTQTLQMIFDLEQAVHRLHAALKPGGVLLLTVPGITQLERGEWGDKWCWSFTATSIRKLFERCFDSSALQITTQGNVFAAIAYLSGAALEEIDQTKLDLQDPTYPVIVTLRAQKD